MYIKVRFETGVGNFTYWLPEEYEDSIQEYDEVLVNAKGFLRLAQVVELNCTKPIYPCRVISAHLPVSIVDELTHIGDTFV